MMKKDTKLIKQVLDNLQELNEKNKDAGMRSVKMGADNNPKTTKMDFLPKKVLKKIAKDRKNKKESLDEILEDYINLKEKKSDPKPNEYQKKKYKARGQRGKDMAKASELYKKNPNDPRIYKLRADSEEKERNKKGFKTRKRSDSMKEQISRRKLRQIIMEALEEEMLNSITDEDAAEIEEGKGLSAKTKATLKKKAEKRGLTPSSVYAEYKKGLAAWASSGSRKGMSQHQWAHARVNSATPSKPWAVVKKAKKKKKK
jgi:hypothetical protein